MSGPGKLLHFAIGLMLIALVLLVYTFRHFGEPGNPPDTPFAGEIAVVIAARALRSGDTIAPESVAREAVRVAPPSSFRDIGDVIGRSVSADLEEGEVLVARHLGRPSQILASLAPNERAVAVKVDGVIGLGGFAQPGDRVDVLLYLSGRSREVPGTRSQVLLEDVRILAFGTQTEQDRDGKPVTDARTAVLAVPTDLAPRLMLGAHAGSLRLGLRASSNGTAERTTGARHRVETLARLLGTERVERSIHPAAERVIIHRAGQTQVVQP